MNSTREFFPDNTPIDGWFYDTKIPQVEDLGSPYVLTEHGICDDGKVYTKEIQALIDRAFENGGGVIVVPAGTYMTGSLFFKQNVHLYVSQGGVLKGSDDISDYALKKTRIEGESCVYYCALINADGVNGFTICGQGIIDGNGHKSWRAFWLRREWNPVCTNKDEQRPRLVYISNSKNVILADVHFNNSHFWTTHIYKCDHVKYLNCSFYSPAEGLKAPSTDAIDVDACTDVLIKGCYIDVDDDGVALKGGKGPWADTAEENGANERIIIEDCECRYCHGFLTCGSESIHNRNVIVRRIKIQNACKLLWLKMRPDTPQLYEYISVEDVEGNVIDFINVNPWTQFFDLKGRTDIPLSIARHITMINCKCQCKCYFNVAKADDQYHLSDFVLENLEILAQHNGFSADLIESVSAINVKVEKRPVHKIVAKKNAED